MAEFIVQGTGRCGTKSMCDWMRATHPINVKDDKGSIDQRLIYAKDAAELHYLLSLIGGNIVNGGDRTICALPIIEQVWPGCKYIWLRRKREHCIGSMYRRGWGHASNTDRIGWPANRLVPDEATKAAWKDKGEKCAWYHDKSVEIIGGDLETIHPDRRTTVWLEEFLASADERKRVAEFVQRSELATKKFPHLNRTG